MGEGLFAYEPSTTRIVKITGTPDKIDAFKSLVEHYGIIQLARTGVCALPRGVIYE
jgi:acetolactate synthase-1/3 small subunit